MDSSLRSTLCRVSPLKSGRFEEITLVGIGVSPTRRKQQKQPMKIRREIARVPQSGSNRCAAKRKELRAVELKGRKRRVKTKGATRSAH